MATRARGIGKFAAVIFAVVVHPLAACGHSTRKDGTSAERSGGSGGSSGSTVGPGGGSGAETGGAAPTGGRGGASGNTGSPGGGSDAGRDAGSAGDAGGGDVSPTFHWIEPSAEHRERAAAAMISAQLSTIVEPLFDHSVVIGTSTLTISSADSFVTASEGIVWTEATGTTGLGGLAGGDLASALSTPTSATSDGTVVVGNAEGPDGYPSAFRWTRSEGMEAIAGGYALAEAVSEDGSVVLGSQQEPVRRAFRWTRASGAAALEPLAGDDATHPIHLSADGATVVAQSSGAASARLFVWTLSSEVRAIENLPGYANCRVSSTPRPSKGLAVGGECSSAEGGYDAFVWAGQERLLPIGRLDMWTPSSPVAISPDGAVAFGQAGDTTSQSRPYRWTETGGIELIELPDGYTRGTPAAGGSAVSDNGAVVVGTMGGAASRAFLWSENTGVVVLSPLGGHNVSAVFTVSLDGTVAVGTSLLTVGLDTVEDMTAVYWRADGVAHRIIDELGAAGLDLGEGVLEIAQYAGAPLAFVGYGRNDASHMLGWLARLQ